MKLFFASHHGGRKGVLGMNESSVNREILGRSIIVMRRKIHVIIRIRAGASFAREIWLFIERKRL
jgi:hypothetical protein